MICTDISLNFYVTQFSYSISLPLTQNLSERSVTVARTHEKTSHSMALAQTIIIPRGMSLVPYNFGMGCKKQNCWQISPYLGAITNFKPSQDIATGIAKFSRFSYLTLIRMGEDAFVLVMFEGS